MAVAPAAADAQRSSSARKLCGPSVTSPVAPDGLTGEGQHIAESLLECDLGGVSTASRPAHDHALFLVERDLGAGLLAHVHECGLERLFAGLRRGQLTRNLRDHLDQGQLIHAFEYRDATARA